jgi:threonine/homoserine/homoserine lactone efflux protein
MEISSLAIFAVALLINAGSPGPSIVALTGRVLAKGWRDVAPFVAAMWLGEAVWLTMAVIGMAALAETFHLAFLAIKYLGVAYLVFLAWKMWCAPVDAEAEAGLKGRGGPLGMFLGGLTVTLGNPKIMVFYLALLPTLIETARVSFLDWAAIAGTMLVVLVAVDGAYIAMAARARLLLKSPRATRLANRAGATAMGGAATAIAVR